MTAPSERIRLQDTTCPLIRLDTARRRDKSVSFSLSLLVHIVIFFLVGISLIKAPQFAVDKGISSMEVELTAAPAEKVPQEFVVPPPLEKTDLPEPEPSKPVAKAESVSEPASTGGAITEAKPDYLRNPAPAYPEAARRRGYEGTVLLKTLVDKNGYPVKIEIEQGSGHSMLDEAALKAVRKWQFRPGMLGNIPVESTVRVPIRFDLESPE